MLAGFSVPKWSSCEIDPGNQWRHYGVFCNWYLIFRLWCWNHWHCSHTQAFCLGCNRPMLSSILLRAWILEFWDKNCCWYCRILVGGVGRRRGVGGRRDQGELWFVIWVYIISNIFKGVPMQAWQLALQHFASVFWILPMPIIHFLADLVDVRLVFLGWSKRRGVVGEGDAHDKFHNQQKLVTMEVSYSTHTLLNQQAQPGSSMGVHVMHVHVVQPASLARWTKQDWKLV